ncbi:unnamed protein product [Caenorhabditis auriculariae]|uniref:Uncharacterized protein n=1 Tax=Caenorhabditis auriculariae TaxID=2777116 RepID=A0A8S1HHK5_9PELO|nr:unnamed protein product [Caenorhabditis auriculariae]
MQVFTVFVVVAVGVGVASADSCYACSGTCHSDHCNCQMGSCHANQCFSERRPTEVPGVMRITKGCLRHSSRRHAGCEYDHFRDHVSCICSGRFCNENITKPHQPRPVTCRSCTEKNPDCDDRCTGHWCHEDSTTGASGCGFGPPALPFFFKGPEVFYYRNKQCVTLSRGAGKPRRHCICNTDMCNTVFNYNFKPERLQLSLQRERDRENSLRSRSLVMSTPDFSLPLYNCINCEMNTQDAGSVTSSCKQNRCKGHYCTYASQRHFNKASTRASTLVSMNELQGCLNVSDSGQLQIGCSRKWMPDEYEEVLCACRGNMCNRDEITADSIFVFPLFLSFLSCLLSFL